MNGRRISMVWCLVAVLAAVRPAAAQSEESSESVETIPVGIDFMPFVGTSTVKPNARRVVSLSMAGSLSGGIDALELNSAFGIATGDLRGAQLSGAFGIVAGDVEGALMGGAFTVASGDVVGGQLGGGANVLAGDLSGLQSSGALNIAAGDVSGGQVGGGMNVAWGDIVGAQITGGINFAAGDVKGVQIGNLNVSAGRVRGLQLGVFNVARSSSLSIGAVSIMLDGLLALDVFGSEEGLILAGLRHGGPYLYNLYHVGVRVTTERPEFAYGTGLGWRTELSEAWEVSVDTTVTHVFEGGEILSRSFLVKLRPLATWRPFPAFAIFGGPTLNFARTGVGSSLIDRAFVRFDGIKKGVRLGLWVGATAGLRFF